MGLREYLQELEMAGKLGQGARESLGRSQLADQLPTMVQQGDVPGIAAQALRAGIDTPLTQVTAQKKQTGTAMTAEQLRQAGLGLSKEQTDLIGAQKDPEAQFKLISAAQKQQGLDEGKKGEQRRVQETVQKQREKFSSTFDKVEKKLKDEEKQFSQVKSALDKGTLPADALVFNFLARNVAGEKGPLSDSDIARFAGRAFEGDVDKVKNFFAGGSSSVLTADQREAYKDLIKTAYDKFDTYKKDAVQTEIENAAGTYPKLFERGVDKSIAERAKRFGYEAKDGKLTKTETKQIKGPMASLINAASKIKDPAVRAQFINSLEKNKDKQLNEKQIQAIEDRIKAASGG